MGKAWLDLEIFAIKLSGDPSSLSVRSLARRTTGSPISVLFTIVLSFSPLCWALLASYPSMLRMRSVLVNLCFVSFHLSPMGSNPMELAVCLIKLSLDLPPIQAFLLSFMSEFPPIFMSLSYRLEGVGLSSSGTSTPLALESSDGVVNGPGREFKIDSFLRRCNRMIHSALGSCSWIGWNLDRSAHKEFHPGSTLCCWRWNGIDWEGCTLAQRRRALDVFMFIIYAALVFKFSYDLLLPINMMPILRIKQQDLTEQLIEHDFVSI